MEAIATLEAQRGQSEGPLERAVEMALLALRDKLAAIQLTPGDHQQRHLAVLVADLSGFTALSEWMDAENVRDALNAMWAVLDPVIAAHGGQIDQHAGDSLLALFGLPQPRQGDAVRALRAALTLQAELALFNDRARAAADAGGGPSWAADWPGPRMRIGVHSGPVYFARPSASARVSAVGETVAVARRLERAAPAAGVMTSAAVYRESQAQIQLSVAPAGTTAGRPGEDVYLALGERVEVPTFSPALVAGQITRLIGRTEELDQLELALQATVDSGAPQVVSLSGAAGVGKSRLVHEFVGRARLLTSALTVLHAAASAACPDTPYALVRDLLLRRLGIRPQDSDYLAGDRIRRALGGLDHREQGRRQLSTTSSLLAAHETLRQLLDVRAAHDLPPEQVLGVVDALLRAMTATGPVIVILEQAHRADRQSLDLVERLVHSRALPVLFLVVSADSQALPELLWPADDDPFAPVTRLVVPPLSAVDGRLMATDILSALSPLPMRLLDLVVAESGGIPLYIEAFIRLLMERGVITVGERWRVDMAQVESTHLPSGLPRLMEARLLNLPALERRVLQLAAVAGPLFWDSALLDAQAPLLADATGPEVEAALISLEMRRYFVRDATYSFAATQAYAFRREAFHDAVYHSVPAPECQAQHLHMAHWLIANRNDARFRAWFPVDVMIARHFAAAGETTQAAIWQRRGGPALPIGPA